MRIFLPQLLKQQKNQFGVNVIWRAKQNAPQTQIKVENH